MSTAVQQQPRPRSSDAVHVRCVAVPPPWFVVSSGSGLSDLLAARQLEPAAPLLTAQREPLQVR